MSPQSEQNDKDEKICDSSTLMGKMLAHPSPGDEICITGLSGVFPNSKNVSHYRDNLMDKVDMVDDDFRRWKPVHPEIPQRTGKIYDIEKFDAGFFGVHHRQAHTMDPMSRIFLEKAIEAIMDAGVNPAELEGTRTGVFVGVCFGESEREVFFKYLTPQVFALTGCMRTVIPTRLSYYLKLKGPSIVTDTACSSSLYALENAYVAMRTGLCDMAIVGGANLCLHPFVSLQFARLGVLSLDGCCKSFDANGNGYCRSEAVNCVFLQKTKDARRIYSTVLHAKTSCDGYKEQGITYPSGEMQKQLLQEVYDELDLDPSTLSFLEAHGTGTKVGDPEEVTAIDEVFCVGRETPLLIGSVKSNIGHSEPASGLCSVAKCIIGMEEGIIPPNLHYSNPREGVKALEEGRVSVVSEKTPFQDDRGLVGINSFGFGGSNCHVLLKWNPKIKVNRGEPEDNLPRLVVVSGRVPEAIESFVNDTKFMKIDVEYIQLLHEIFKQDIEGHSYRGFIITSKQGILKSSSKRYSGEVPPLVIAFGNLGGNWAHWIAALTEFSVFVETINKIRNILLTNKLNLDDIIEESNRTGVASETYTILGNVIVQIGIVEILKLLKLKPDAILGYSIGEIVCGYFCDSLTLKEAILVALEMNEHMKKLNEPSTTIVVEGEVEKIKKILPSDLEILWKNRKDVVTISGDHQKIDNLMDKIATSDVKVTKISSSNVTLHSRRISKIENILLQKLRTVIPQPKRRCDQWISASTEKIASPEYFVKALIAEISFEDACERIGKSPIIFEIGFGELSTLLKYSLQGKPKTIKFEANEVGNEFFLQRIGRLYEEGLNPQIQHLYPKVSYPVSRGTPMISPKILWNHSQDWNLLVYKDSDSLRSGERMFAISLRDEDWQFTSGHVVDGRNLFPATGYLKLVWETLGLFHSITETEMIVVFDDCRFIRATPVGRDLQELTITIQRRSGQFEIVNGGTVVVTGTIRNVTSEQKEQADILPSVDINSTNMSFKTKDIYKELRLRGYNYKGLFRGVQECNSEATVARIKWEGNWIAFMDNMLQIQILQIDTRLLYVPTGIQKMTIDAKYHLQYVESFGEDPVLPVYFLKHAGIIRCGGIEISGLKASSIPRRKQRGTPVLEKYVFVPNETVLSLKDAVRINMQMGLENLPGVKVKVVELIDEETIESSEPLGPTIFDVFADLPLIQVSVTVLSKEKLDLPNVTVEDKQLRTENDCHLVVGTNILQRAMVLQQAFSVLKDKGFILSRERLDFDVSQMDKRDLDAVNILTIYTLENEKLVYFRKAIEAKESTIVKVSEKDEEFRWLSSVQTAVQKDEDLILFARNEPYNGLLGFINCLRREPGGNKVRCFLILDDDSPEFDVGHPFYAEQLRKIMSINIYKNGRWGTYRHLTMEEIEEIESEHCFINATVRGDLSSLKWIEGSLNTNQILPPEKTLVQVYYASINFRDIMTASGRINADVITMDRMEQECVQGFEFAGRELSTGRRVMGMVVHGALTTMLAADAYLLIDIPEKWSMEEAATVPVVYGTVIHALLEIGKIKKGYSVLIHSGSGGVGQAGINFALSMGCTVFTTVGSPEKREFLKQIFPQLQDSHIGNSRDTTFEQMIKQMTRGRGVDIVLNSLAEDKQLASIRCLARGGKFLEIGKFDLASNSLLRLRLLERECSFHGIMLDQFFTAHPSIKRKVHQILSNGVRDGSIRPLTYTVFKMNEIEQAFRHMTTGKHTGKVMIQIRKEEKDKHNEIRNVLYKAIPRFSCDPEKSYVIVGGLGGFGLELADWLILRGARRIVLSSRNGVRTGYQQYRIRIWKSYGCFCEISTEDVLTYEGCQKLIEQAQELGPIQSIFNLAVVLKDSLLENQNPESFRISLGSKAKVTENLDRVTRKLCSNLGDFVVFSSVSCGRGNAGQTNYGMANSVMERICERRKADGFPALAIQWGAVGDVGLVADMMEEHTEMEIGGTLQQRITSCLSVMDVFLRQDKATIVSSMLVAEKRVGSADNIVDAVANILGIKKQSVSPHATLSELGMDSMTAVEIKQTLEREFEVFLTAQDIRSMTFARLQEIQDSKEKERESGKSSERVPRGFDLVLRYLGDEKNAAFPLIRLPSLAEDESSDTPYLFCFPGIEGFAPSLKPVVANLKAKVFGLQYSYNNPKSTYKEMAKDAYEEIVRYVRPSDPIHILTYSWGTIIGFETLSILETRGYRGTITCIDGAPDMLVELSKQQLKLDSDAEFETIVLCHLLGLYLPYDIILKNREKIYKCNNFDERLLIVNTISAHDTTISPQYQKKLAIGFLTRLKELQTYDPDYPKIVSQVRLYKPSTLSVQNFAEDYNLSRLCANLEEVKTFDGNHITILNNTHVAEEINRNMGFSPDIVEMTEEKEVNGEDSKN